MKERCGVIGVYNVNLGMNVAVPICEGLYALQHRGQESCGIYTYNGSSIVGHKAMGLVGEVFDPETLSKLTGYIGIGHVRYSTTARSTIAEAQPFCYESPQGKFAMAFNGTIANFLDLRKRLEKLGHTFVTQTDTEVLAHLISEKLADTRDYGEALFQCMKLIDGACSLTLLNDRGELYGMRDSLGFKPLEIGFVGDESIVIASESSAIETLGGKLQRDIVPGEIVKADERGIERLYLAEADRRALCMFELVYFARPDSVIQGINVYEARIRLGRELARTYPADIDVVVPVPDSGRTAAIGYAEELGAPLVEGLIKNRYIWRTFIMPGQDVRELSVRLKLNPIRSLVSGKDIALVDDSIVRGTTMKRIVSLLKSAGAKSVHVRISCPPIISSCYMGIDFPTRRELVASKLPVKEIASFIGADSLEYQTLEGLLRGIGLSRDQLCLACLTSEYPLRRKPDFELLERELGERR